MRKLSLFLVICMLLVCFASCGGDDTTMPTPTGTKAPTVTKAPQNETDPTEDETDPPAPETPQDKWTERY